MHDGFFFKILMEQNIEFFFIYKTENLLNLFKKEFLY